MCGLVGFLRASGAVLETDPALVRAMAGQVAHRGPDDEGVWLGQGCGLGHRRLSVIDVSALGHQPMQRGRWSMVLNGEIYNYLDLRAELEARGESFQTQSDTEVLLAALTHWGVDAIQKLNGMFAFALWDSKRRELLLARDRIGKKPLYYAYAGKDLVFGSEIKAILQWPGFQRAPNLEAIHHYLSMQYVPSPLTAFEGVFSLPPGHFMLCRPGEPGQPRRYWDLPAPGASRTTSEAELAEQARDLLARSVKRRLVSDVPVGAFLSGGVDSSAVTALMAREAGGRIKTFSIGFAEAAYDERRYARMVAERYSTDHHEEVIEEDATSVIPNLVWHYGQPFADPSAIPTYFLSRLTRKHVTVALSGDGGDELFLGYERYATCARFGWVDNLPKPARALMGVGASSIRPPLAQMKYFRTAKRLLQLCSSSRGRRYEPTIMYFSEADKHEAYADRLRPWLKDDTLDLLAPYLDAAPTLMEGASWADLHSYLPDDILVKVDVASMAFGLEARAPFLDVEMMEWAARTPAAARAANGQLKSLLKDAVTGLVPDEVIKRPKMGFGAPLEVWLRGNFASFAREVLTSPAAQGRNLFRPDYVLRMLDEHQSGRRLHHLRLWALLMLELWFVMWIDGPGRKPGFA
ncbi:MAG TPA: asparagine synthase (glutamine-hydrolyzing) [Hyphomonadaceae bacterium]|nr:asparagine synthase (glutamine-hydrolyzing) [Hyphomonadaceae bacterium]